MSSKSTLSPTELKNVGIGLLAMGMLAMIIAYYFAMTHV
ncbi:hypothetical protein SAMN05444128_3504 [Pontibacter indicus]|uniref:Uncharacterized protein n=1 Tax=Pontibacter indicus TaxID=1317125 RepID=A0A1R3XR08_9BACT|nr:hypothetical protein SAMN05444128_3504 [Pontibacter indicus]